MDSLTYAEVGATRDRPLPSGYHHLTYRTSLGRGGFASTAEDILSFRMHRELGVRIRSSAPRAAPGVDVACGLGLGPVRLWAPCRVIWVTETENEAGFGYGTLPGHPERGEESFVLSRDDGGQLWFTVTAFSRPAVWYARAAGPVVPVFQAGYARMLGRTLRRLRRRAGVA
jgi:uncharacterized protein (UPF0548 family)